MRTVLPTARQQEVLDFILSRVRENGYPPTLREIRDAFGFGSPNAVLCHLKALEKKGLISRGKVQARAIVVHAHRDRYQLPLLGCLANGRLVLGSRGPG